jgi:uncharacterized protein YqeY
MKLIEQIRADRMVAFKAKENIKKNILGCLISESCKENKEPEDVKVLAVIKKFIENAKEIQDAADEKAYEFFQATQEIDILETYRPKQLTAEEIRNIIKIQNDNLKEACGEEISMPSIMKYFKTNYDNQYDGKLLSQIAKETK